MRLQRLDGFWDSLKTHNMIPYTYRNNAVFLYRSQNEVTWNGDFNNWGNTPFLFAERLSGTDLWVAKVNFPRDARLDYKIVDGKEWILDPNNPHTQWSGYGVNSELRMPDYRKDEETRPRPDIAKGELSGHLHIPSEFLGDTIQYNVYLPHAYNPADAKLPVIYVTDGHEYSHPDLGNMITVLDNLIFDQKIPPVIAVFVSPIVNGVNRRMEYYVLNAPFAEFMVKELIPEIENSYNAGGSPDLRAIMGTSLGGLNSAYFAVQYPDVYGNIAMHSPAIGYRNQILHMVSQADSLPSTFYVSTGTINDNAHYTRELVSILEGKSLNVKFTEVSQGHSWGNWTALLDEPLIHFWGERLK